MVSLRLLVAAALLFATPAFAEGWRVESVSGDAAVVVNDNPDALDVGATIPDGATVVTGPSTSLRLVRRGDTVTLDSDSMADIHGGGGRGTIEPKTGLVSFKTQASEEGPLHVDTRFFRAEAQAAQFSVTARKDFASLDVDRGFVDVRDSQHPGDAISVRAGGSFKGLPAAKPGDGKGAAGGDPDVDKAMSELDKQAAKSKGAGKGKKESELVKKLAARGAHATKEGLDALADEYNGDNAPPEAPRMGLLAFLFGKDAPNLGAVLGVLAVLFIGLGGLASSLLGEVAFGMFGNGLILLLGALLGAALHDFLCPPDLMWAYEPGPVILLTLFGSVGLLIGACFLRRYVEDRMEAAERNATATVAASGGRRVRR